MTGAGEAVFVLGLPGSGKSTYAKTLSPAPTLSFDDLRRRMLGASWSPIDEARILDDAVQWIRQAHGINRIVVDESLTCPFPVMVLLAAVRERGLAPKAVVIDAPVSECWERRRRTGFPKSDFFRKVDEWRRNRELILARFPTVEFFNGRET